MTEITKKYKEFLNLKFPDDLKGEELEGIDIVLLDAEIAGLISSYIGDPKTVDQGTLRKCSRKLSYVIDHISNDDWKNYLKGLETPLLMTLESFGPEQLKCSIRNEIDNNREFENLHGIDNANIKEHLLDPPVKTKLYNDFSNKVEEYWIVLDEIPNSKTDGYMICYSEDRKLFGLALKESNYSDKMGSMIGFYGDFMTTLKGM